MELLIIYFKLFCTFTKIGIFNFGGGYAMLSLIQDEVVNKNHWLSVGEFTDIVAISQSTPGPIGINAATYTGYTAVVNSGFEGWQAVIGAVLSSLSIIWLPFVLMISISRFLMRHSKSRAVTSVFASLRPAIVGLLASAAIMLCSADNFGSPTETPFLFIVSLSIFFFSFVGTRLYKIHPILMLLMCGVAGLLIY